MAFPIRHMTGLRTTVLRLTATAAIAAACAGCVYDHDACPPQDAADGILGLRIELTVPGTDPATRTGVTRAEENVHGDGSFSMEDGARLENMIDVKDYKVVVFDKNGAMAGDVVMEGVTIEGPSGGDHTRYTLSGMLHVSATDARTNLESFRIMVLANWEGFDTDYEYPVGFNGYRIPVGGDAISDDINLYKDGTNFNFTMPTDGTAGSVRTSWGPTDGNGAAKSYIPMFGISGPIKLKDAQDMGKYSDNPVANISMLRALAKIEIVDMVPDEAGANMDRCVLTRSNKYGRFIPDVTAAGNAGWDTPDKQISAPSLPALYAGAPGPDAFMTGVQFIKSTEPTLVKFDDGTEKTMDKDHYVIYVPEMDLSDLSVSNVERPVVQVDIDGRSYDIQLSTYAEGKAATPYTSLLRNHIYRFNVKSVGISADLGLEIETPYWDLDDDQVWDYEDMKAGFTQEFHWIDPTYETPTDIDADSQRILLVNTNDGVEGRFTLESPKNTKWILSLIADDGTPNYWFRIDMWDNEKEDWIVADQMPDADKFIADTQTGDIDGKPVRFRIIPTASNSSEADYSARVVLTLQTFDGRVMNVKLTSNSVVDPDEDDYYYKVKHLTNGGDNM